jgi:hypothetical protein
MMVSELNQQIVVGDKPGTLSTPSAKLLGSDPRWGSGNNLKKQSLGFFGKSNVTLLIFLVKISFLNQTIENSQAHRHMRRNGGVNDKNVEIKLKLETNFTTFSEKQP